MGRVKDEVIRLMNEERERQDRLASSVASDCSRVTCSVCEGEFERSMQIYRFDVVVAEEITEELSEALFEAGCDDSSNGRSCGVWSVSFTRESESLELAMRSAMADVRKVGLTVTRVEIDQGEFTEVPESA